jgi:hypothetical protein
MKYSTAASNEDVQHTPCPSYSLCHSPLWTALSGNLKAASTLLGIVASHLKVQLGTVQPDQEHNNTPLIQWLSSIFMCMWNIYVCMYGMYAVDVSKYVRTYRVLSIECGVGAEVLQIKRTYI